MKSYPGLIRLLEHKNVDIANATIISIYNILLSGSDSTTKARHPHFDAIQECGGVQKIYQLYCKNKGKFSRDRAALCIAVLFRAREIADAQMRHDIISHLKALTT
ncbi:MAG: hypothetical protein EZS28_056175, partial [Streblomastix strix]